MDKKIDKTKLLKDVSEKLNELDELNEVEEMIQDNAIEFDFEEKIYRVRKLNRREKHEIKAVMNKEKYRLLNEETATEEELIQIYLNRKKPINIPALRQEIKNLQVKIEKLAVNYIECNIDSEKKKIEAQCEDLKMEQLEIMYKIDDCFNISLEYQLKAFVQEYMIYLCLEKQDGEKWSHYYKDYDAFMDATGEKEDKLVYKATYYFNELINRNE